MNKENNYETPCIMEIELLSEQAVLSTADGGDTIEQAEKTVKMSIYKDWTAGETPEEGAEYTISYDELYLTVAKSSPDRTLGMRKAIKLSNQGWTAVMN